MWAIIRDDGIELTRERVMGAVPVTEDRPPLSAGDTYVGTTYERTGAGVTIHHHVGPDPGVTETTIRKRTSDALATIDAYLAVSSPTNVQNTAQLKALSRQVKGLIRLTLGQLDSAD